MFKVDWIFIPIAIIYFVILVVILVYITIKILLNKFNDQIEIDMQKICRRNVGPIGPIIPFQDISKFDKRNAYSFLNLDFAVSIWSGCQQDLPPIQSFDIIQTYQGYDYAAGFNRNIAALYYSKSLNIAIMSFAGTMYLTEWTNDFDFAQSNPNSITSDSSILIHNKDYIMYNTLRNDFISSLNKIKDGDTILIVTGISLGGALATICFFDVISNDIVSPNNRTLYSFAAPRVGNVAFANVINKEIAQFRIVNTEDIIPTLPLPVSISGNTIYEQTNARVVFSMNLGDYASNHVDSYANFLQQ